MLNDKIILITGGTGSFGNKFVEKVLEKYNPKKIIIYSRDEYKQYTMRMKFKYSNKLRFFIGNVRDKDRLYRALNSVDYVVHAAALKQVPSCEYNPFEAVKTNVLGAQNIIDASIDRGVKRVVALSTDKAVNPINIYGATKLVSDKLFIQSNAYSSQNGTIFSIVRYGNVASSRGSVIPFFKSIKNKIFPITDLNMTRFYITLDQAVELVFEALKESKGGETFISKIPSFKITELAYAIGGDNTKIKEVGIREGEKIHEIMITKEDSLKTYEYDKYYIIYPTYIWWNYKYLKKGGKLVKRGFTFSSDNNKQWLDRKQLRKVL